MTRRQLMAMGVSAAATFGLAMAGFWPAELGAAGEGESKMAEIATPRVVVNGCELMVVRADEGAAYKLGDTPTFKLVVRNPGDAEASLDWAVSMSVSEPVSPLSRRMPGARLIWENKGTTTVSAKETKEVVLGTDTSLPTGSILVLLRSDKQVVVAMRFGIQGEKKAGEPAELHQVRR